MENLVKKWKLFSWPAMAFLVTLVLVTACNKNNDVMPRTPEAGFMAFNLAVDKPSVGFSLSGNTVGTTPLSYTSYTGVYLPIFTGNREVKSFDYSNSATLATSNFNFADSMYYSAFLMGANGNYRNLVVQDNFENVVPVSGKAWIRYVNAIPDSSATVTASVDEVAATAPYGTVSDFSQVDVGKC